MPRSPRLALSFAVTLCVALVLAVRPGEAQHRPARQAEPQAAPILEPSLRLKPAAQPRGALRRVLHVAGGAVIGSGMGYFFSQVLKSDWDKQNDAEVHGLRSRYAGGGAVLGAVLGFSIGTGGSGGETMRITESGSARHASIGRDDILRSGAATAYDAVSALRPAWFNDRGLQTFREGTRGASVSQTEVVTIPGEPTIKVYLDNAKLGGVQALREISALTVGTIQYLNPVEATMRYGRGHSHGVILVQSVQS